MFARSINFVVVVIALLPGVLYAQSKLLELTVADIHAAKHSLLGKQVRISGEVTKVFRGASRKYYIHIQDGSGSREQGNFDVTVVSKQEARVGEKVRVEAVVIKKRDFGFSDNYILLLDDAVLSPIK